MKIQSRDDRKLDRQEAPPRRPKGRIPARKKNEEALPADLERKRPTPGGEKRTFAEIFETRSGEDSTRAPLPRDGRETSSDPELSMPGQLSGEVDVDRFELARHRSEVTDNRREAVHAEIEGGGRFDSDGTRRDRPAADPPQPTEQHSVATVEDARRIHFAPGKSEPTPAGSPRSLDPAVAALLQNIQIGEDVRHRKTVLMQVEVPGRGSVSVRLRQDGDGYQLRLRASDDAFGNLLRTEQGRLRASAHERGLRFTRIDVVK